MRERDDVHPPRKDPMPRPAYSLLLACYVLVGFTTSLGAQSLPTLSGYRLGQTWMAIAREMPCEIDTLDGVGVARTCNAEGGTRLLFKRDTLIQVMVFAVDSTTDLQRLWDIGWRQRSSGMFGLADSVSQRYGGVKGQATWRTITARWARRRWCALVELTHFDKQSTDDGHHASSVEVRLYSPRQTRGLQLQCDL